MISGEGEGEGRGEVICASNDPWGEEEGASRLTPGLSDDEAVFGLTTA